MKYTAVLAVLFSVVAATPSGGCEAGTTVTLYADDMCTEELEQGKKVITEEEAAQVLCAVDTSGKNTYKLRCDANAFHWNFWVGSKNCTGSHVSTNLKWGKCTNSGNHWAIVTKPAQPEPTPEPTPAPTPDQDIVNFLGPQF